jgi:hypothetical protein
MRSCLAYEQQVSNCLAGKASQAGGYRFRYLHLNDTSEEHREGVRQVAQHPPGTFAAAMAVCEEEPPLAASAAKAQRAAAGESEDSDSANGSSSSKKRYRGASAKKRAALQGDSDADAAAEAAARMRIIKQQERRHAEALAGFKRVSLGGQGRVIEQLDLTTGAVLRTYDSRRAACEGSGIVQSSISACIANRAQQAGGFKWQWRYPDGTTSVQRHEKAAALAAKQAATAAQQPLPPAAAAAAAAAVAAGSMDEDMLAGRKRPAAAAGAATTPAAPKRVKSAGQQRAGGGAKAAVGGGAAAAVGVGDGNSAQQQQQKKGPAGVPQGPSLAVILEALMQQCRAGHISEEFREKQAEMIVSQWATNML